MRPTSRTLTWTMVFVVAILATILLLVPADAIAGKGNGGGKGKPPKCDNCPPTITLPNGDVCTLEACGSDCVYSCPLPG